MKILTLCYEFPPIGGGGARVVYGLARELVSNGHEVDLVTMGFRGLPRREEVDGIQVHRVPCLRRSESVCQAHEMVTYLASALPVAYRLARRNRYDINHTHFIFPDGVLALLLWWLTRLPYVITTHGSDVPGYNPDRFNRHHRYLGRLWQAVIRHASQIVCPSETLERLVLKQGEQIPVSQIPNGVRPTKFNPSREKFDRILVVTRMFPRKGVQYVIEGLRQLPPGWELHVVGDGPYLPELRTLADERGAEVVFHGWLDNGSPVLRELYETARIFVFTSEAENFPTVLLEAMAAGCAIVTTSGTGCAEVVGDAGVLVQPRDAGAIRDAVDSLIAYPALCHFLSEAGRERLERQFSWASVTRRYVDVYARFARPPKSVRSRTPALTR
jgi:glycosyltransferase involved in cell wall biosynthesis